MRPVPRSAKLLPSAIAISADVLLFVRPRIGSADDATLTTDGALELTTDTARDGALELATDTARDGALELAADGGFEAALALGLGLGYGFSVVAPKGAVPNGGTAADELDALSRSANLPTPEINV